MRLRRLAAPALLGLVVVACQGEPVASANTNGLTSAQRASIASALVDAAGTGDGAAGAGLAAALITSGAPVTRIIATRDGFASVARIGDSNVAASVTTAEGAVYNVVAFEIVEPAFNDTIMGTVAWDVTADNKPTSFVVSYAFGEGTGRFDMADGGPTAYGYVFKSPSAGWTATTGSATLLRKSVGAACESFQYPGVQATCRLATFTGAIDIVGSAALATPNNSATGSPTFSIQSTPINGVMVEVTPSTAAAIARRAR